MTGTIMTTTQDHTCCACNKNAIDLAEFVKICDRLDDRLRMVEISVMLFRERLDTRLMAAEMLGSLLRERIEDLESGIGNNPPSN